MLKYKAGDNVQVVSGKDKDRKGVIEKVIPSGLSVIIPDLNIYKKHVKGQPGGRKAGIYEIPRPIPFSKIALICPNCKKMTRVGFRLVGEEKVRVCKKCDKEIRETKK